MIPVCVWHDFDKLDFHQVAENKIIFLMAVYCNVPQDHISYLRALKAKSNQIKVNYTSDIQCLYAYRSHIRTFCIINMHMERKTPTINWFDLCKCTR